MAETESQQQVQPIGLALNTYLDLHPGKQAGFYGAKKIVCQVTLLADKQPLVQPTLAEVI